MCCQKHTEPEVRSIVLPLYSMQFNFSSNIVFLYVPVLGVSALLKPNHSALGLLKCLSWKCLSSYLLVVNPALNLLPIPPIFPRAPFLKTTALVSLLPPKPSGTASAAMICNRRPQRIISELCPTRANCWYVRTTHLCQVIVDFEHKFDLQEL